MRKINLLSFLGKWPGTEKEIKNVKRELELDRRKFKTRKTLWGVGGKLSMKDVLKDLRDERK